MLQTMEFVAWINVIVCVKYMQVYITLVHLRDNDTVYTVRSWKETVDLAPYVIWRVSSPTRVQNCAIICHINIS